MNPFKSAIISVYSYSKSHSFISIHFPFKTNKHNSYIQPQTKRHLLQNNDTITTYTWSRKEKKYMTKSLYKCRLSITNIWCVFDSLNDFLRKLNNKVYLVRLASIQIIEINLWIDHSRKFYVILLLLRYWKNEEGLNT